MPYRVELVDEAVDDLVCVQRSGRIEDFLRKLLRLEEHGPAVGLPLGSRRDQKLSGWFKIVAGNRDWRIVFNVDEANGLVTVWVIGDRNDEQCYLDAARRIQTHGGEEHPTGSSLASSMMRLLQRRGERR